MIEFKKNQVLKFEEKIVEQFNINNLQISKTLYKVNV